MWNVLMLIMINPQSKLYEIFCCILYRLSSDNPRQRTALPPILSLYHGNGAQTYLIRKCLPTRYYHKVLYNVSSQLQDLMSSSIAIPKSALTKLIFSIHQRGRRESRELTNKINTIAKEVSLFLLTFVVLM